MQRYVQYGSRGRKALEIIVVVQVPAREKAHQDICPDEKWPKSIFDHIPEDVFVEDCGRYQRACCKQGDKDFGLFQI